MMKNASIKDIDLLLSLKLWLTIEMLIYHLLEPPQVLNVLQQHLYDLYHGIYILNCCDSCTVIKVGTKIAYSGYSLM